MAQSLASARGFIEAWNAAKSDGVEVAIFPSYVHLPLVADLISRQAKPLKFGAQDCSTEEKGAFTGEISAGMIAELKSSYVLIGHSERRQRGAETNETLVRKLEQALKAQLTPVFCLGETEAERGQGRLLEVLERQSSVLKKFSEFILVAYEPVWAIGTGKVATEADIESAHKSLRAMISEKIPLLYGGSVNSQNAPSILKVKNVDGLLVGGASLKAQEFEKIAASV